MPSIASMYWQIEVVSDATLTVCYLTYLMLLADCNQLTFIGCTKERSSRVHNQKAVIARRYLRQGKAIRQVASPYLLCQRFPYVPF